MINHFLGAGLVLALLFLRPEVQVDLRYFKDYFFILLVVLSLLFFGIKRNNRFWQIPVLIIYSFVFIQRSNIFQIYYQWTLFVFGMILLYQLSTIKLDSSILINYLCIGVIICSAWCILESFGIDLVAMFYKLNGEKNITRARILNGVLTKIPVAVNGPLGNQTITGALIGSLSVCFLRKRWIYFLPIAVYAMHLCQSAMSVISFCTTIFIFCCIKINNFKYITVFTSVCLASFVLAYERYIDFFSDTGRLKAWAEILKWYGFNLFGKSNGWFYISSTIRNASGERFGHCHSEPMDLYIAFGITGLVLFGILLSKIRLTDKYIFCVFSGLLINSLANLTFHISVLSYIAIICYSILSFKSMEDFNGNFKHEKI